ncbi:sugar ABC transporter substrate-binding protein [Glutamicibacter halophytocola]|uniref:Sugar ABC transporter substrate-binding protein n=1 Tax=Glutamicibacter halophytocola TaxID=1933880 RepID=A0ABX5YB21_9MICC|nr:sugar ABC transporter substrate-binding protein [Glutamicibacter halophytocola]QDY66863.1 sugar ABC transporter substrate-binding protein [Glutamicibacter halophytocola]
MSSKTSRRLLTGTALTLSATLGLTACGGSQDPSEAAAEGGELTIWAWEPTLDAVVDAYEAEHPEVKIDLVNVGTGNDQYTALQNAISAGSGGPDLAQIEYFAMGQFELGESLAELNEFGADQLASQFATGPWEGMSTDGSVYGLPMDSGPMAMFYNQSLFEKHNIQVPKTWEEYAAAARKLHQADPKAYMVNDTGDAGFITSLIWQAGGKPFNTQGTEVGIDLADEGSKKVAQLWQPLLDDELVAPITSWSDQWYQGLGDGTIASLVTGAWMPANLESGVPDGSGDWRVAPMPQWEDGTMATAENGGSGLSIMENSEKAALAYDFLQFATVGEGADLRIEQGAFPATTKDLEDEKFLNRKFDYFGGQQINKVLSESSASVIEGWSYLPFQAYANSIFNDTVGKAYIGDTTLGDGLAGWQDALKGYATDQGFTAK